jgi:predicted CoA-substrate-specific enzyme activase
MYCGIDLGSRNVKIALVKGSDTAGLYKFSTIEFYRERGRLENGQLALDLSGLPGLTGVDMDAVVATGYGRQAINMKNAGIIPEIKAHMLGAAYLTGETDFTLLDLGGQDSKVALVKDGKMVDFMTNDKCAASTGRYLENMAAVLGIDMEELSLHHLNPVELTSTCAIFGETELIGKVVEGHSTDSLAAGVNYTIFKRIKPMLARLLSDRLIFTGGVARNGAIRIILEQELNVPVIVPEHPEFAGALGCCAEVLKEVKAL